MNTPTVGQFDFANLTTDNVDHLEILRGGGGALYGSEAIGGVVNVLTRRGTGPLHLTVSGEAGSAAAHHESIGLSGARGPLALSGTVSFLASDGFRSVNDDYRNFSTVWRGDADVLPGATVRGIVRYINTRAGLVNFNVAENRLDPDAHSRSDFLLAKGEWEHTLTNALSYRSAVSFVRDNERFRDDDTESGSGTPVVVAHFPSEIITAEAQGNYLWRQLALTTLGLEFQERSAQVFHQQSDIDAEGEVETDTQQFNANRSTVAVYLQEQLTALGDRLRGTGGVRYDHNDGFSDQVTWSGSGGYLIEPTRTRLRIGYAEGFRAPTFSELFEPNLGNRSLQPEQSWEIDAGITQEFELAHLHIEPTYFYRHVTNLIEEVADELPGPIAGVPETTPGETPLARNLNARFQGVELLARARPVSWLRLDSTYTYLNFVTPTGTLLNRPRHRGSFVATAEHADLLSAGDLGTCAVVVAAVGHRDSADPFQQFEASDIGGYARTDLSLTYHLPERLAPLTLTATVRNLFNRDYSESIGFPAPPARALVGFRYTL